MPLNIDNVRRAANLEKVRRHLIRYFVCKVGKEGMNRIIDPCCILDLTVQISPLSTKIEVMPHAEDMKLLEDQITIGWNLFVLGNQQMYLGRNFHSSIMNTINDLKHGMPTVNTRSTEFGATPKKIIAFILRVLEKHRDGYVPWVEPQRSIGSVLNMGLLGIGSNYNFGIRESKVVESPATTVVDSPVTESPIVDSPVVELYKVGQLISNAVIERCNQDREINATTIKEFTKSMMDLASVISGSKNEIRIVQDPIKITLENQQPIINIPKQKPPVVNVNIPAQKMARQKPPIVNVSVPEQKAPIVTVNVPEQKAPIVNVTPSISVEPANVTVNVPEQKAPDVVVNVPKQTAPKVKVTVNPELKIERPNTMGATVVRDADGKIVGIEPNK